MIQPWHRDLNRCGGIKDIKTLDGCAIGDRAIKLQGKIVEVDDSSLEGEIFEGCLRGGEGASEGGERDG